MWNKLESLTDVDVRKSWPEFWEKLLKSSSSSKNDMCIGLRKPQYALQ